MAPRILTLTTDFGTDGPYVASMKGVILGRAPGTQFVDVSHSIAPQDIAGASFILAAIADYFPEGTVHLAVVDPGVGTSRRLIAIEVSNRWFVLPDNGLISEVLRGRDASSIRAIQNPDLRSHVVSSTFHGRDILAPAAAHLLNGGNPADLGPAVDDPMILDRIEPREDGDDLFGEVIFIDSFGNLITNINRDRLGSEAQEEWSLEILGRKLDGLVKTYGDCSPGTLVALIGSSERIEVAVVNGSAERQLGATRGAPIRLRRARGTGL